MKQLKAAITAAVSRPNSAIIIAVKLIHALAVELIYNNIQRMVGHLTDYAPRQFQKWPVTTVCLHYFDVFTMWLIPTTTRCVYNT